MTPYFCCFTICCFVCRAWWGVGQAKSGAFCITATATCDWYNGHQRGGDWHKPASTEGTLKTDFQNEEELRHQWTGSVLCDGSHWRFHKTEWVLLPAMPKRRFGAHSWQSGGLAPFSRDPAFCEGSAAPTWDSWERVLRFGGKLLTEDELERQRDKILRAPLVVRDKEYPYREDLIPDASGNTDPQLPVLAKVSSLVDVLQLGGSYELVERLWERFVLTASRVNVSVAWSRNEVLVSSVCPPGTYVYSLCHILAHACVLVNHSEWNVPTNSGSGRRVGEGAQTVWAGIWGPWFSYLGVREDVAAGQFLSCGCEGDRSLSWRC